MGSVGSPIFLFFMFYDNKVWFNDVHWKGKKLSEFLEHEKHTGLSVEQLTEAFGAMNPPAQAKPKANDDTRPAK